MDMSNTNEIEARLTHLEKQCELINARMFQLEAWINLWDKVIKEILNRIEEAQRSNTTLVLRDVINPWADTTTVEDLLHMLESECPVTTVLDAILKKEMTLEERQRLVGNLKYISNECMKGIVEITKAQYSKSQEVQP